LEHLGKLVFAVFLVDQVVLLLDDFESFIESLGGVLCAHVAREFSEVARRDVDHFLLADSFLCAALKVSGLHTLTTWEAL